jgi:hypothetical protein
MASVGARSNSGVKVVAKSAILWLTAGAVFASIYGALLSVRSEPSSLIVPHSVSTPVIAMSDELPAE